MYALTCLYYYNVIFNIDILKICVNLACNSQINKIYTTFKLVILLLPNNKSNKKVFINLYLFIAYLLNKLFITFPLQKLTEK